ncbi:MAG TPA: hypothetical protein VGB53_04520 [Rubricoccaceae bacterium]
MPDARPDPGDAVWADLAARAWHRVRWRASLPGLPDDARCAAFGTPLHRAGTYYRRPVYTDGTVWLSQPAFDEMQRRAGRPLTRRTRPG